MRLSLSVPSASAAEKVPGFYCPFSRFTHSTAFALVRYKGITLEKKKKIRLFMQATSLEDSSLSDFSEVC